MLGGPKRVIWHTTENDPAKTTAATIAYYLNRVGYQCHLIWNPVSGEIIQMIPSDRAGRALRNLTGGVQTNRQGSVCTQIEVVGRAVNPFTDGPMVGRETVLEWVRSLGIPDVWPAGPPPRAPKTHHASAQVWNTKAGHYGHSQVPENDHNDPGCIDIRKLFGEDVNAKDVWEYEFAVPWATKTNPEWMARNVLKDIGERVRRLEAAVSRLTDAIEKGGA